MGYFRLIFLLAFLLFASVTCQQDISSNKNDAHDYPNIVEVGPRDGENVGEIIDEVESGGDIWTVWKLGEHSSSKLTLLFNDANEPILFVHDQAACTLLLYWYQAGEWKRYAYFDPEIDWIGEFPQSAILENNELVLLSGRDRIDTRLSRFARDGSRTSETLWPGFCGGGDTLSALPTGGYAFTCHFDLVMAICYYDAATAEYRMVWAEDVASGFDTQATIEANGWPAFFYDAHGGVEPQIRALRHQNGYWQRQYPVSGMPGHEHTLEDAGTYADGVYVLSAQIDRDPTGSYMVNKRIQLFLSEYGSDSWEKVHDERVPVYYLSYGVSADWFKYNKIGYVARLSAIEKEFSSDLRVIPIFSELKDDFWHKEFFSIENTGGFSNAMLEYDRKDYPVFATITFIPGGEGKDQRLHFFWKRSLADVVEFERP